MKYNVVIGFAAADIAPGTYVHSHNVSFKEYSRDYAYTQDYVPTPVLPPNEQATFEGYVRPNGSVGTRNFIGVLSTVNCSATVVHKVAEAFKHGLISDPTLLDRVLSPDFRPGGPLL